MTKLLERDSFFHELEAALKEATAGQGHVALVCGEAGIGKTSLVEHFTRVHRDSTRILWGGCDSLFTPRPLSPLYDIATQLEGELPALLDSNANRQAIFSACLVELQSRPTIVVFEDVHWADEATLDLIKFLGRRIQRTVSLFILTYRDDELGAGHPLRLLLGDLPRGTTTQLQLPPLSKSSVFALAHAANQGERADKLFNTTNGNPFFVTEALASKDVSNVPATVRDAVLARAARLSLSARAVLEAAAVIGSKIESWLLSEVTRAEVPYTDECISAGMLQTQNDTLVFRHELARQSILETISPQQRIALHRMTLNALKESPQMRNDLARLAHHAAGTNDAEAVLKYAPAAAKRASAASSHREAAALYELALQFSDVLPLADHAEMLKAYADESGMIGNIREEIAVRQKLLEIWGILGNHLREGENLAHLSNIFVMNGRNAEAEKASRDAIEMLEALPANPQLALAYIVQANQRMLNLDFADAVQWCEKAIALAKRYDDKPNLRMTYTVLGAALIFDDFERGRATLEYGLLLARELGLERSMGALETFAGVCCQVYQFALADRYLSEGMAFAAEHDLDNAYLFFLAFQALSHLYQGRWNECAVAASSVLQRHGANAVTRAIALVALVRLRARRGDPEAMTALGKALELTPQTDSLMRLGRIWTARVEALWLAGQYGQAREEASAAFDVAVGKQHAWFTGEMAFWQWRMGKQVSLPPWTAKPFALQIAGDWRGAAEEWEGRGCPYEQAMALMDGDQAGQIKALEIFERLGARPMAEFVRQKLGMSSPRQMAKEKFGGLTAREREVAALIAQGKSNREIAEAMTVGVKTIETYVTRILNKLGFDSRVQIATWAVEKGLK